MCVQKRWEARRADVISKVAKRRECDAIAIV